MNQQQTTKDLIDLGWKKGHRIFIDGKLYPSNRLKELSGSFLFQREENNNAVQRNIYYSTHSVQLKLL